MELTRGIESYQHFFVTSYKSQKTINKNYPVGKFEYLDDYLPDTVRRISTCTTGLAVLRVRWFDKKQRTQMKLKIISKTILNAKCSIFCIHFSNFLINYMVKIIYFLPNLSKRKNTRRVYLRKRFCRTTLISYLTYFGEKNRIFLILKIKT